MKNIEYTQSVPKIYLRLTKEFWSHKKSEVTDVLEKNPGLAQTPN